jgi:PAS domain S-box-containing protein
MADPSPGPSQAPRHRGMFSEILAVSSLFAGPQELLCDLGRQGKSFVRKSVGAYGVAVAAVGAAVLLRWLLDAFMGETLPLVTLFAAVAVAVWAGGYLPALVAAALGYLACAYLFIEPRRTFALGEARNLVGMLAYLVTCSLIIGLGEAMRASQRRFEELVQEQEPLGSRIPAGIETLRQKHSLRNLIVIGFGLLIAVLIAGAMLGYSSAQRLADNVQSVSHSHAVIGELEELLSTLKDAETGQRGFLLTEDERYLQPYDEALKRVQTGIARLQELTSDDAEQQARLAALEPKVGQRLAELRATVALLKTGDRPGAMQIVHSDGGRAIMDDLRQRVAAMRRAEDELLRRHAAESEASSQITVLSIVLTPVIGILLVCVVFYLSQRNLLLRQRAADVLAEERERLRVTLASIGDAVIATDVSGRVVYLNGVAEAVTGWPQAEAIGKTLEAVFHIVNERTRSAVENPATRALREGVIVGLANHSVLIRKDGTERPIDDSASPIRDGQGHLIGCVLVFRDVTGRRRVEQQLADDAARIESIVNHAIDGIIAIDEAGTVEAFNPAAERLFGYRAEEVIGRNVKLLMPEPFRGEHDGYLANYRRTGQAKIIGIGREVEGRRKDGSTFPMDLAVSEFRLGQRRYFTGLVRDITERKRAEKQVYGLLIELKEADRRKDEFLALLAHELRGPLAPLRNMLEVMKIAQGDAPGDAQGDDLLQSARDTMERQLAQLVRLVDDLLDVSRISRDKITLRQERVELAAILQQSVEACRPLAEQANHHVSVDLPPQPIYLHADAVRLAQVFSNILNNACKYTEAGGKIWLSAERQGSDVLVRVKDTGLGIPADKLGSVFEMFTQVDRTLERSQGGLGIGLTLVKRLVEMHGGSVEALSEGPGRGSEFAVRLPVLIDQPEAKRPVPSAEEKRMAARRVLVVDDSADAAASLSMLLTLSGNTTRIAHDGLEALELAEKFRPEVILLDIGLPKLNGFEVCRRIRQRPWGRDVLVVALTGWGQDDDRRKSKDAGFDHHLVKPVDYTLLMELLAAQAAQEAHSLSGNGN